MSHSIGTSLTDNSGTRTPALQSMSNMGECMACTDNPKGWGNIQQCKPMYMCAVLESGSSRTSTSQGMCYLRASRGTDNWSRSRDYGISSSCRCCSA